MNTQSSVSSRLSTARSATAREDAALGPGGAAAQSVQAIVGALCRSRRYRDIDPAVLARLGEEALGATDGAVDPAVKRAKRRLHQIFGAYLSSPPPYERMLAELASSRAHGSSATRVALREAMARHASSRERLPILEAFYAAIFARVGRPRSILDLACGFNPLTAPWMDLTPAAVYQAVDMDRRLLGFVGRALDLLGINNQITVCDAAAGAPDITADLALVLKTLPCLEQQYAGSGMALLDGARAPVLVVSFPTRSLSGRDKGMRENYGQQFEAEAARRPWRLERLDFGAELAFIVWK